MVLQRFIKCKGGNAFICRAHWRKQKAAKCYIITNKIPFTESEAPDHERYATNQAVRFACSIIESKGNSTYHEPITMTEAIAKFVQSNTGARFSDLVADFAK